MKTEVSFHSTAFNCGANGTKPSSGTCFGEDLGKWLIGELRNRNYVTANQPHEGHYCWCVSFDVGDVGHLVCTRFWPNDRNAGDCWHCWVERKRNFVTSLVGGRKRGILPNAVQALDAVLTSSDDIHSVEWREPSKAKKIAEVICPTCGERVLAYRRSYSRYERNRRCSRCCRRSYRRRYRYRYGR
jgi:hypothetical protein